MSRIVGHVGPIAAFASDEATKKMNQLRFRHACVAALALLALLAAVATPALAAAPTRVVMVLGDSLSAAYGLDTSQGWVSLMAAELRKSRVEVVNASTSGETTQGGRARIAADLKRVKPAVVLIALGGNDGLRGLPVAETRKNLAFMVQAAKSAGARVVLAGMQIPPNYGLDYARDFREQYAELARRERVVLIPFLLAGIGERLELFQADKVHPTATAQPMILANVLPAVRQALAGR